MEFGSPGCQVRRLAQVAADDLGKVLRAPSSELIEAAIDSMAAYFVARFRHDDASRLDPEGFM